jgi:hypothetical protein
VLTNEEFLLILQSTVENKLYKIVNKKFFKEYPQIQIRSIPENSKVDFNYCHMLCGSLSFPVPKEIIDIYKEMFIKEMYIFLYKYLDKIE